MCKWESRPLFFATLITGNRSVLEKKKKIPSVDTLRCSMLGHLQWLLFQVIRIFQQICSRGHRGVRIYLRGKDGELRKVAASGGPPDPVLANTPQLFLSSAIQVCYLNIFI